MDLEQITIEELKRGECSLERALLVVSGLQSEEEVAEYQRKLGLIQESFEDWYSERKESLWGKLKDKILRKPQDESYKTAEALFDYFFETKPKRYKSIKDNGDFLLAKVIDNKFDEDRNKCVGNCVGLTSLYSVLGVRVGLELLVLASPSHVLTLFSYNNRDIVVENTNRFGFDSRLTPGYEKKELITLVSFVFNNRGVVKADLGNLQGALLDFDKALELNPDDANAYTNRGIVKFELGNLQGALLDYDKALELNPDYADAYNNRGIAKADLGNLQGALLDYDKALELNPDYADAYKNRGVVKYELGDLEGAEKDFARYKKLRNQFLPLPRN